MKYFKQFGENSKNKSEESQINERIPEGMLRETTADISGRISLEILGRYSEKIAWGISEETPEGSLEIAR